MANPFCKIRRSGDKVTKKDLQEMYPGQEIKRVTTPYLSFNHIQFHQVIPDSHFWTDINQLLHYISYYKEIDADFLRIGLENTLKNGYNIRKTEDIPAIPKDH